MKMNKDKIINELKEETNRSDKECIMIYEVLEKNGIVGRKNKEKIKLDFISLLNISESEANKLYNLSMKLVVKNFVD